MATTKKQAAKKPSTAAKPEPKSEPELTRDQQRLLATYERRMALKRLQGMA